MQHTERLQTSACPPNYKFAGYERDPETGLDYAFARYYSSLLGRFLSTDPLGGSVGSLQSHNAYAYALNNPLNASDPSGTDSCDAGNNRNCPPIMRGWGQAGGGGLLGWDEFDVLLVPVTTFSGYYFQVPTVGFIPYISFLPPELFNISAERNPDLIDLPIYIMLLGALSISR